MCIRDRAGISPQPCASYPLPFVFLFCQYHVLIAVQTGDIDNLCCPDEMCIRDRFMCAPLLREERRAGKWILALEAGYRPQTLLVSKILIYGLGASIPVFIMYNLYYTVGRDVYKRQFLTSARYCPRLCTGV